MISGPTSSAAVLRANQANKFSIKFNLKGFIVANGIMDDRQDTNSIPLFMQQHALITKSAYENGLKVVSTRSDHVSHSF